MATHPQTSHRDIDDAMTRTRAHIDAVGDHARETAWMIERHGLMVGKEGLTYGGRDEGYDAVSYHPVWGTEIRDAIAAERRWNIETGPLRPEEYEERWWTMERWEGEVGGDVSALPALHRRLDALTLAPPTQEQGMGL